MTSLDSRIVEIVRRMEVLDRERLELAAFATTCRAKNVPVAVERSRSGNGAHEVKR